MIPAALLFDMDGLLLDTEQVAWLSMWDVLGPLGLDRGQTYQFFLTLVGSSGDMTRTRLIDYLPDGTDVDGLLAQWGPAFDARVAAGVPIKPGVADTIRALSGAGHRMAVVTSTSGDRARAQLTRAGLMQYFETLKGGDEVSAHKPNPAPYLETAAELGVDPRACYAFEDSDRGLSAAHAAGCRAVQIPDLRPPDQPFPDLGQQIFPNLTDTVKGLNLL